jgi:hypothetical protein
MSDQLNWFKSSYSDSEGGDCVEIAFATTIHVRDSKVTSGPELHIPAPAWAAFISAVQLVSCEDPRAFTPGRNRILGHAARSAAA